MDLAGRTALVTGAAGGLGEHLASALRAAGAELILSGRNEGALEELRERVGGRVVVADLARREDIHRLAGEAAEADVLVNNAGVEMTMPYLELSDDQLEQMIAVNLTAPMVLARELLRGMLARGRGHVVFIASMSGKVGISCNEPYAATKAGLIGLTRSLRGEFRDAPVGFSVVAPGFIANTGMYERMDRAPRLAGEASPEAVAGAVIRAIEKDLPAVTVNGTPMAPALALQELAPRAFERVVGRFGLHEFFERQAAVRG